MSHIDMYCHICTYETYVHMRHNMYWDIIWDIIDVWCLICSTCLTCLTCSRHVISKTCETCRLMTHDSMSHDSSWLMTRDTWSRWLSHRQTHDSWVMTHESWVCLWLTDVYYDSWVMTNDSWVMSLSMTYRCHRLIQMCITRALSVYFMRHMW